MTTITDTRVEALRARAGSTLAGRLGAHIERRTGMLEPSSGFSATSYARCWSTPSSAPHFTPGVCAGSILSGSSSTS
jgi:hypothetical protein